MNTPGRDEAGRPAGDEPPAVSPPPTASPPPAVSQPPAVGQPAANEPAVPIRPDPVRVERAMRGAYSAILCLEALVLLLVPRAMAQFGPGLTTFRLVVCFVLAAALIVLCVFIKRPWAYNAGLAAQIALIAMGFLISAMFFLGAVFGLIWWYAGRIHRDLAERAAG